MSMMYKFSYHGSTLIVPVDQVILEITDEDVIILTVINSLTVENTTPIQYYGVKDLITITNEVIGTVIVSQKKGEQ